LNPWISTRPSEPARRAHSAPRLRRIVEIVRIAPESAAAFPFSSPGAQGRVSTCTSAEEVRAALTEAERIADFSVLCFPAGFDLGDLHETLRRLLLPVYVSAPEVPESISRASAGQLPVSDDPVVLLAAIENLQTPGQRSANHTRPPISVVRIGPTPDATVDSALIRAEKLACVRELAAGLAHEMNNLVTPVAGYAQLIRGEIDDEGLGRKLDIIEQSAFRASRMINDLLAFSRLAPIETETVAATSWLEGWCREAAHRVRAEGITFASSLCELPSVQIDRARVEQAMDQVLRNAVQAVGTTGSEIRVTAETRVIDESDRGRLRIHRDRRQNNFYADRGPAVGDRVIVISIHDDGPGIEPDLLDRIYYPFFTTRDPDEGPGLGLSVAFGLLQAHGGTLSVVSADAGGVDAHLVLPAPTA